jgi:hypothetical protein
LSHLLINIAPHLTLIILFPRKKERKKERQKERKKERKKDRKKER